MLDEVRMWPSIEEREGPLAAAFDTFKIVFFLEPTRCESSVSFLHLATQYFERELALGELTSEVDEDGEVQPLLDREASIAMNVLRPIQNGEVAELRWFGAASDASSYARRFDVHFLHNQSFNRVSYPEKRSVLAFRVTHEAFVNKKSDGMLSAILGIAERVPFSYGYASPALHCDNFFARAYKYIDRYPGLDVVNPFAVGWDLGQQILGPYWINLLGEAQVSLLGGAEALSASLSETCRVLPIKTGGVCLQIEHDPDVGDVNRGNDLPAYRRVADTMRDLLYTIGKVQYFQPGAALEPREAQEQWHRRFLP